ncbi:hypothetical protein KBC03_03845 [Patescibacteria group bacterium]|nr:hypothetical protein [Patescibacteria group bacterium]
MNRGKDFFVQKFLKSRESSDADAVEAYKVLIGKKPDDDLNIKDLADVQINYEDTFERYIAGAEKSQFTELQEKAVTHTFLDKMGKEIAGAHFAAPQRDAWKQYVASKK